jgi:hypothetical protein
MNLLESILGASGGNVLSALAGNLGLQPDQAQSALASLVPALAAGVKRNASTPQGLESLLGALQRGGHQQYVDDPSTLARPETIQDGNGILGHIFGSKEVSRQVAQQASSKTGVGVDVLKKMLPMVAGLVMAQLAKRQAAAPAAAPAAAAQGGGLLDMLGGGGFLDLDRDGKVEASDLLGMAGKLFG